MDDGNGKPSESPLKIREGERESEREMGIVAEDPRRSKT